MTDKPRVPISARIKPSTRERIEADAKTQDRSPSYIAAWILDKYYADKQPCNNQEVVVLDKPKPFKGDYGEKFESFWNAGMRKVNKKSAQKVFLKILERHQFDDSFTRMLIQDIQSRLNINQLGFAEMHPTTYLNGERWNDEIKGPTNGQANGRKQPGQRSSVASRAQDAFEKRQQQRYPTDAIVDIGRGES